MVTYQVLGEEGELLRCPCKQILSKQMVVVVTMQVNTKHERDNRACAMMSLCYFAHRA